MKFYNELLKLKIFSLKDIVKIVENVNTAKSILQRYYKNGYILKIRRDLYVGKNIVTGEPVANKFLIGSSINESCVVSLLSAFEFYGLTNQVRYDMQILSNERFSKFTFEGINYYRVSPTIRTGIVNQSDGVVVTSIERTLVDCIKHLGTNVGFEELMNCIELIPTLNENDILECLKEYNNKYLYQKTGFILEHYKDKLFLSEQFVNMIHENIGHSSKYFLLNDDMNVRYDSKWHLIYPINIWQ